MARRARILAFGSAAALVVAGAICGVLVGGSTGQVVAIVLVTVGLGGALLLVFFEVGLSEDRARASDEQSRQTAPANEERRPWRRRFPRRPG